MVYKYLLFVFLCLTFNWNFSIFDTKFILFFVLQVQVKLVLKSLTLKILLMMNFYLKSSDTIDYFEFLICFLQYHQLPLTTKLSRNCKKVQLYLVFLLTNPCILPTFGEKTSAHLQKVH